MKKHITILALILILAGVCLSACAKTPDVDAESESETVTGGEKPETTAEMPEDFAIRFTSKTGLVENIYDTYTGTIQKDLIAHEDGVAVANFTPSEVTLRTIREKWEECNMSSINRKMNSASLSRDGSEISVNPNTVYNITVTVDGNEYSIIGDSTAWAYREQDDDADRFTKFVEFMVETLYDEPEYQKLPEAVGGYE